MAETSYLIGLGSNRYRGGPPRRVIARAMDALALLCRTEGIIPAIESAHAVAGTMQLAREMPGATLLLNLSGRGDKDAAQVSDMLSARAGDKH